MFEVGKYYEFHMIEGGGDVTFWGIVEAYDHPLLKLEDERSAGVSFVFDGKVVGHGGGNVARGQIINVTSPNFVSAQEQPKPE